MKTQYVVLLVAVLLAGYIGLIAQSASHAQQGSTAGTWQVSIAPSGRSPYPVYLVNTVDGRTWGLIQGEPGTGYTWYPIKQP